MSLLSGLRQAAFVNDNTQTVVRFDNAHEDTSVSIRSLLDSDASDTRGDEYFVGYESTVEWMEPDLSSVSQMETWMVDNTPIQFCAVGPEAIVQWYEPKRPRTRQSVNSNVGNVDPLHGLMRYGGGDGTNGSGTIVGYPNGTHRIYKSQNALHPYAYDAGVSLLDTDNNGVPDGYTYTTSNLSGEDVTSGVYEAFGPTNGNLAERGVDVLMPIEGVTWTFSVEVTQLHSDGDTFIYLSVRDDQGVSLNSVEQKVTSTGRVSVSLDAPVDTYEVRAVPLRLKNVGTQTSKAKVTKPALRVDGGTSYVTR